MVERIVVAITRVVVRTITGALVIALAFPHVTVLVIIAITAAVSRGWLSGLGVIVFALVLLGIWGAVHRRSLKIVASLLSKWRAVVFGIRRWSRTVKGLQLDAQDGEKLRAPRVKKVNPS